MKPGKLPRRHPLLWLTGLLLAAAALWVGYFLATFDLNRYREQLASELGTRLQMPVRLGEAHLELREAGIAFSFDELRIGTEQTAAELHAEKIWLQLAWHGLLLKKPILTEVALNAPRLRLSTATATAPGDGQPATSFDLEMLRGFQINRLEVRQGSLEITWLDPAGQPHSLALGNLSLEVADLGLGRTVAFHAVGNLLRHSDQARLAITGSVALPEAGSLRDATWELALGAKSLEAARLAGLLPEHTGISAQGQLDLAIHLQGALVGTVTAQAELSGNQLRVRPGAAYQQSLPLKHLHLAGTWQHDAGTHRVRQLAVQLDDLRLAGEFSLSSSDSGHLLTGQLSNATLPLDSLRQWMPPALLATNPLFSRRLPGGRLALSHASFRAEIPANPQGYSSLVLDALHGEATALSWDLGEGRRVEISSLALHLENNRWQFERGTGTIAGLPATVSATVSPQNDGQQQFSLDLAISGPAGQFIALQSQPLPAELTLTGDLSFKGHLEGTPALYNFDMHADLGQLAIGYGEQLRLPPHPGNHLSVRGQGTHSALAIEQGTLALSPIAGRLTGTADWAETPTANFSAHAELTNLASAYDYAPAIAELQLQGGVAIDFAARGPLTALKPEISLDLMNVSVPARGIVADITQLNGRLLLEGTGLRSEKLAGRLGESPVNLRARVADLAAPRLELDVQAATVRADELIFRSDRNFLRDIDGHLIFDRDGLQFAPVKVSLDGGTRAMVNGSVKNFASPLVDLDITGTYANVGEIIGLWTDESPAAEKARRARHDATPHSPLPPIRIKVEAREGDLYGMKFANAKALIVPTDERLLIHPLDFNVGEGYCTTQVLVDYSGKHTVLRTSGHVENVDAYEIVNELLDRKSIMRGSLRGDFYLQGELGGGRYLPTSFGNVNVSVRDGVMRHSPVLSTVFSLLNVSQLFSFKLPDVNREGVPFTRLAAELAIDKGILSSDRVVIDSEAMNMSYIGKYDMVKDDLDMLVVVKPLGTIDKVVTSLPIAGWILGGEEKALITAQFRVTGPGSKPKIEAIPISAMSKGVLGLFQRALSLPLKLIEDPAILWGGGGKKQ